MKSKRRLIKQVANLFVWLNKKIKENQMRKIVFMLALMVIGSWLVLSHVKINLGSSFAFSEPRPGVIPVIRGTVIDAAGKPLADVDVYDNNRSIQTAFSRLPRTAFNKPSIWSKFISILTFGKIDLNKSYATQQICAPEYPPCYDTGECLIRNSDGCVVPKLECPPPVTVCRDVAGNEVPEPSNTPDPNQSRNACQGIPPNTVAYRACVEAIGNCQDYTAGGVTYSPPAGTCTAVTTTTTVPTCRSATVEIDGKSICLDAIEEYCKQAGDSDPGCNNFSHKPGFTDEYCKQNPRTCANLLTDWCQRLENYNSTFCKNLNQPAPTITTTTLKPGGSGGGEPCSTLTGADKTNCEDRIKNCAGVSYSRNRLVECLGYFYEGGADNLCFAGPNGQNDRGHDGTGRPCSCSGNPTYQAGSNDCYVYGGYGGSPCSSGQVTSQPTCDVVQCTDVSTGAVSNHPVACGSGGGTPLDGGATTTLSPPVSAPGQGVLKIGRTNHNGIIIFDDQFVQFLRQAFNDGSIKATILVGGKPLKPGVFSILGDVSDEYISLNDYTRTQIPGGLEARYEKDSTKRTKNISYANGVFDLSINFGSNATTTTTSTSTTTTTLPPSTSASAPKISSFSPLSAQVGDNITVKGRNFIASGCPAGLGAPDMPVSVRVGGQTIGAGEESAKSLQFRVPEELERGAYKIQVIKGGCATKAGQASDYSTRLLSIVESSSDPTVYYTVPLALKRGKTYNVTVYGTNLSEILNVTSESGDLDVDTGSISTTPFSGNKVKIKFSLSVSSSADLGLQYLTLEDDSGNSIRFSLVVK